MKKTSLLELLIIGVLPFSTKLVVEARERGEGPPPDNDLCQNAQTLSVGEVSIVDIFDATTDDNELLPTCFDTKDHKMDRGVWFRVKGNGGVLKASTCVAGVDISKVKPIFGAFKGDDCNSLECEFYSTGWNTNKLCSEKSWQTEINQMYWIIVDERNITPNIEAGDVGLKIELGQLEGGVVLSEESQLLFCNGPKAKVWGDPHFVTFDQFKYDCQGQGDFVISKSLSSVFEIQGRFQKGAANSDVTVTKGLSWIVEENVPKIEVRTDPSLTAQNCPFNIYVDGELFTDDISTFSSTGFLATEVGNTLVFVYTDSKARIEVTKKMSKKNKCVLGIQVCLPDSFSDIVGMLGSPDGNKKNDWMSRDGETTFDLPQSRKGKLFSEAYNYCVTNWCVESADKSLFDHYESNENFEDYYSCNKPYDSSSEDAFDGLSDEDLALCVQDDALCSELADGGLDSLEEAGEILEELDEIKNTPCTGNFEDIVIQDENGVIVDNTYVPPIVVNSPSPPGGNAYGDPHITLWSGRRYDFHGACDLVLLKNPSFRDGMGLTIHIRTKFTKEWSFIESAVIRLGSDTFELKGSKNETLYWINGEFGGDLGKGIAGHPLEFKETNSYQKQFVLRLNEKEEIALKTFKELVRVDISSPTVQSFGSSEGLLGRYPTGERLGRDRETVIEDASTFGQEWQVLVDEDMLFHAVDGAQAPKICPLPDSTSKTVRRRRLIASSITEEDAKVACSRVDPNFFDSCVFDVLAINDKDVAGSY